ncbi:hypothetical protein QJS83_08080 [Bdellovibrio sp. 22V]|uniref:hypothetical protein n=1 Tax=Bdellovibrio TaxID=958 RepID=UPI002542DA86|nr:hypothetical protein [Bdellovibrio sp. 22V]WII73834.1 hypothetical protein QJS83_08080 [Bdellovibrio sp. 22V]
MSGHHKNRGFSQTSKRYDGALKAQHQQSRNKQMDHPSPSAKREEAEMNEAKHPGSPSKKNRA